MNRLILDREQKTKTWKEREISAYLNDYIDMTVVIHKKEFLHVKCRGGCKHHMALHPLSIVTVVLT
jgi:hypothetical protein